MFFLIAIVFKLFFSMWSPPLAQANVCYDITTAHKCPQKRPSGAGAKDSFNTENLQKAHTIRVTVEHLNSNCGTKVNSTSQNIVDIYKVIERAQLEDNEKFICKMSIEIQKQNLQVEEERQFMLEYIGKQTNQVPITREDKIRMTSLLIKYRLMENKALANKKDGMCSPYSSGGVCYFALTRFSAPKEVHSRIQNVAINYVNQVEEGPDGCIVDGQRQALHACLEEIQARVSPIPAPLILAQATQESGWGKSAWVRDYNNFLGLQQKFKQPRTMACYKNCRCAGTNNNRCAMKFDNITACLYEYYGRFNASPIDDYKEFRALRSSLPSQGDLNTQCQNARELIPYLDMYAEDPDYQTHICNSVNTQVCQMMQKCPQLKMALTHPAR